MDRSRSGSASTRYLRSTSASAHRVGDFHRIFSFVFFGRNLKIDAVVVASGGWSALEELTGARSVHHVCGRERVVIRGRATLSSSSTTRIATSDEGSTSALSAIPVTQQNVSAILSPTCSRSGKPTASPASSYSSTLWRAVTRIGCRSSTDPTTNAEPMPIAVGPSPGRCTSGTTDCAISCRASSSRTMKSVSEAEIGTPSGRRLARASSGNGPPQLVWGSTVARGCDTQRWTESHPCDFL